MWWFTPSLKIGALKLTYGGVTHLTQEVGVVALLIWEYWKHIIYGASGEITLTLNMVAQVTQVIIHRCGRRENPMLNHLVIIVVDEGRRWHIIALLHYRRENPMLDHLVIVAVDGLENTWRRCRSGGSSRSSVSVVLVLRSSLVLM